MALNLPDRHGRHTLNNDSRVHFDATTLGGFLQDDHGLFIICCGNPLLHQDYYSEFNGGVNASYMLFGHYDHASLTGTTILEFISWQNSSNPEQFHLRFRPNDGGSTVINIFSETVTHDNCIAVVIERVGDTYALHLLDAEGNITLGSFSAHDANSLGITLRPSYLADVCFGGEGRNGIPASATQCPWRASLGDVILVEQSSAITTPHTKLQNIILGASPVDEFGVANVKLWRTLADTTAASLQAEPTATSDTYTAFTLNANKIEIGSPLLGASATVSARITERKYNFYGVVGEETDTDMAVSGTFVGSVTSIEGRLLLRSDLSVVQDWAVLDASPSLGTWSGSFDDADEGVYCVEVRPSSTPANVYAGRNDHVVGFPVLNTGQSQMNIAWKEKSTGTTLEALPVSARGYAVDVSDNSGGTYRPSVIKLIDESDYNDLIRHAQIEWERVHASKPIIWCRNTVAGTGIQEWLDNDILDGSYRFVGDKTNWNTGLVTDIRLALGTDAANYVMNWGTNDKTDDVSDYKEAFRGNYFNLGSTYTESTHETMSDIYPRRSFVLSPLTRAIGVSTDNHTADPVDDDYLWSAQHRETHEELIAELAASESEKIIMGPSVNDMLITSGGGPHQPTESEAADDDHFLGGTPRLGYRIGQAVANLHNSTVITLPSLGDAMFTDAGEAAFKITVDSGSFGALKTDDVGNSVSGFEISENGGTNWSRKGFTATYSGQDVTISKSSGDWLSDDVQWRYHKGGPYSYGTSYITEMRADIKQALYATGDQEGGLGVPITQKTNGENGGLAVADFVASSGTTLSIDEFTVEVDQNISQNTFVTGDVCAWSGSDITINSITPAWDGTMHGAMVDPVAGLAVDQGFDVRLWSNNYNASVNVADDLPVTLSPPFTLLVSKSIVTQQSGNDPQLDTVARFTFLTSEPAAGSFAPPYHLGSKSFVRNVSEINHSLLASHDRTNYVSVPDLAAITEQFRRPQIEIRTNYQGRAHHPSTNQPTYGREIAKATADALLSLNLDYTSGEKQDLLYYIIQYGIDLYGMIVSGGELRADGGHNMGRLGVLAASAKLLDNAAMLAAAQSGMMQETQQVMLNDASDVALARADGDRQRYQFTAKMIGHLNWGAKHENQPNLDKSNFYPEEFLSGDWAGQTGSAYVPYGVDHAGKRWRLDADTTAIETIEPGVTGWTEIGTSDADYRVLSGSPTLAHILAATMMGIDGDWNDANVINYYKNKFWQMEGPKAGTDTNSITDFVASMYSDLMPSLPAPVLSAPTGIDSEGWCKCTTDSSGGDFTLFAVLAGGTAPDATTWESGAGANLFIQIEPSYQYEYLFNAKALDNVTNDYDVYYRHKNLEGESEVVSSLYNMETPSPVNFSFMAYPASVIKR